MTEVLLHLHPKQLAGGAHNIHTAGEFAVDLHSIKQGAQQHHRPGLVAVIKHTGNKQVGSVGNDHLLKHTPKDAHHRLGVSLKVKAVALHQPGHHDLILTDRALCHLGEEAEKQRQFEEVTLRLVLTSVHIHHIADRTQGIVRNTQGQQNLHRLIGALAAKQPGNAVGALSQEIYIF